MIAADEWAISLDRIDIGNGENLISICRGATTQAESQPPELRIPIEGELDRGEVNASPSEVVTVETGTPWISVVTHAAQSLVEQIPPGTLPREFNLPITPTGSSRARLMRVESADGVLRAAFRPVNDPLPASCVMQVRRSNGCRTSEAFVGFLAASARVERREF